MSCSVLTVVTALSLASYLHVGFGQVDEQRDAQSSAANDALMPTRVAGKTHQPSAGSDGGLRVSQLPVLEEADTTPNTWDAITAPPMGGEPATIAHFLKGDGPEDIATTYRGDIVSTPPRNAVPTPPEDIVITPPDDSFTPPPGDIVSTPPADSFTTSQDNILTTAEGNVVLPREGSGDLMMAPILDDGRVPTHPLQLVICSCPIPTPDACRRFLNDLDIDGKDDTYLDIRVR